MFHCFSRARLHGAADWRGGKQQNQCTAAWPLATASGGVALAQRAPRPAGKRRPPYHLGVPGRPSGTSVNAPRSSREAPTPIHFHRAALRPGEHNETITRRRRLLLRGRATEVRSLDPGEVEVVGVRMACPSVCSSAVQRRWEGASHIPPVLVLLGLFLPRLLRSAVRITVHG